MPDIQIDIAAPLAWVTLNRPDKRNALSTAMWRRLSPLAAELGNRSDLRVVLLRGAGGTFSAGADIAQMQAQLGDAAAMRELQQATQDAQEAWARLELPSIALIEGACVGGGCGLALACDLRLATPDAYFAITPAKLGLVYSLADTRRLCDLVGPARAKEMLFTAARVDADAALAMGLVNRIVPAAQLEATGRALAEQIAAQAPNSVRAAKRIVNAILGGQREETDTTRAWFNEAFESPQFQEGAAAFLAKRSPRF